MRKRPDTVESVLLALELLKRIPRPGKVSAPELHAQLSNTEFARDLRTVQRQLDMLSQHFDIERDERTKPYGYRWKERAEGLTLPSMSPEEAMLLALAQDHLRNLLPASLTKSLAGLFSNANRMLGTAAKARRQKAWLQKVRVVSQTQKLIAPEIRPPIFEAVSSALFYDQVLAIEYQNARGVVTKSNVLPLGLAQQGSRLFLVCRFVGFENERTLALHRFISAEVLERHFQRPQNFDLRRYDDEGRFGFGEGKQVRLKFCVRKEEGAHLIESPLFARQTCRDLGDELEFSGSVTESAHLIWWLRHFGRAIRVISPRRIANQM